jgi:guanylate kinase
VKKKKFSKKLILVTAPSGAGKTTIVKHLLKTYDFLGFSVSATNRARRDHEVDGKDYHFLSTEAFKEKIENNEFVEWEEVYDDQFYGTLKSEVERLWELEKNVIFDIEVNGATNIKNLYRDKAFGVFVKPPSFNILVQRLKGRNTENTSSLKKRIKRIKRELTFENSFDAVLLNDSLDVCLKEAEILVESFFLGKLEA